jgi:hypothetical protein
MVEIDRAFDAAVGDGLEPVDGPEPGVHGTVE